MGVVGGLALPALAALVVGWRASQDGGRRRLVAVCGFGVILGGLAVPWALTLFAGARSPVAPIAVDVICLAAVAAAAFAYPRSTNDPPARAGSSPIDVGAAAVLFLAVASLAIAGFVSTAAVLPHGEWDAWAQWNLRARFFFRGFADGTWRVAFDPILAWSHADYPPLVPATVARLWTYAGRESVAAPIAVAALFTGCTVLSAALSVARTRGAPRGLVAAAVMLAAPSFVRWAPSQCADIAIAFFMLAAFVLWQEECSVLAGLSAGLAAWTKNEGVPFLGLFLLVAAVAELRRDGRAAVPRLARLVAGAAPAAIAVFWFKHAWAPPSYFVVNQTVSQTIARALDLRRAEFIAAALGRELWMNGGTLVGVLPVLGAFALVRGTGDGAREARWGGLATLGMIAAYFFAYLITPLDVAWQLQTSVDRVVVQLVPLAAWSVLSAAR